MQNLPIDSSRYDRPNRIKTTETEKNTPEYHVRNAKWALSTGSENLRSKFIRRTKINKAFFKGGDNQWIFDEDIEQFLKDETGATRSRIKVANNTIKPIIQQYKGNANRLELNARAESVSPRAKNRMTEALKEKMYMFDLSLESPMFKEMIKEKYGVGDTAQETESIFMNTYTDEYVSNMNELITYIENINRIEQHKIKLAENLGLSGLAVMYSFENRGHLKFEPIESEDFIFDESAKKDNLSDGSYMGHIHTMTPTSIFEAYNPSDDDAEAIENYVNNIANLNGANSTYDNIFSNTGSSRNTSLKIPVYKIYFKDVQEEKHGYVMSEYGYPILVRIDFIEKGEESPKYSEADVIEPPKSAKNDFVFKGKKIAKVYNEILRYCYFIPSEYLAAAERIDNKRKEVNDIVLDWGVYAYQGTNLEDPSEVRFPYQAYTWGYIDGEIISPVDDAISPQRLINRILSVTESNINNSGGSNTVIDEDTLNPEDVKNGTVARDIKQGKPIFIRSRGKGVPNSVGYYDNTPKEGVYRMFDIIPIMRDIIQQSTGVNEPLQGGESQQAGTQLVGVTELLIQRGSLMQEPFYKALEEIYIQMYERMITDGKIIYTQNERVLSVATGDDGVKVFQLSGDLLNEDFRVFIKRNNSNETLKNQANQMLMSFMEMGLVDNDTFVNLYNRADPSQVISGLRQFNVAKAEAARKQMKEQEAMMEEEAIQAEADLAVAKDESVEQEQRAFQNQAQLENIKAANKENEAIINSVVNAKKPQ